MQGKKQRERYRRLDRAERAAIQSGLDKGRSCRQMARDLGRSPSTVADEVARNRTVSKGPGKGERVRDAPEDACPKLLSWPRCCNGCRNLRYRSCSRRWRCEYSAARAQALADAELRESMAHADQLDPLDVEGILALRSISERCAERIGDASRIPDAQNEVFMPKGKSLLSTPPVERERSALGGEAVALPAPPPRFRQAPGIGAPLISLAR